MIYFWLTLNWFWTNPLYNALIPSSLAILTKAWSIPRYLISFCLASITWPWSCSRVFVVSIGNVPVTKHHRKIFNIYVPNHIAGLYVYYNNGKQEQKIEAGGLVLLFLVSLFMHLEQPHVAPFMDMCKQESVFIQSLQISHQ